MANTNAKIATSRRIRRFARRGLMPVPAPARPAPSLFCRLRRAYGSWRERDESRVVGVRGDDAEVTAGLRLDPAGRLRARDLRRERLDVRAKPRALLARLVEADVQPQHRHVDGDDPGEQRTDDEDP